jgi:tetratricopeptide (TPR) repeat protein
MLFGCASKVQQADKIAMSDPKAAIPAYEEVIKNKPGTDEAKQAQLKMADAYYKLGKADKANEIIKELVEIYSQDLKYYTSLKREYANTLSYDTQQAVAILQRISYVLKLNKQDALNKEVENVLAMYQGKVDMSQPAGYDDGGASEE